MDATWQCGMVAVMVAVQQMAASCCGGDKLFYTEEYLIQPNSPKFDPLTQYAIEASTASNITCYAVLRALLSSSKRVN